MEKKIKKIISIRESFGLITSKSFKAADRERLFRKLDMEKIGRELSKLQIQWKFIPKRGPPHGRIL